MKRTKIIATLGPTTDNIQVLTDCIRAGVNLVRLNFSHGDWQDHAKRIQQVRQAAAESQQIVGVLADLQGPKIRIGRFQQGEIHLKAGDTFCLDANHPKRLSRIQLL